LNIAIFGGSFDPPHIGHEKIVDKVIDSIKLDKFIVVPTFLNPFKSKYHFEPKIRYELLTSLFDGNEQISISDYEVLRNKATPTIETIEHLNTLYNPKNIYLVIGSDNLEKLHLWSNFSKLQKLVTFVVVSRYGYEAKNDIIQFINIELDIPVSSTSLRESLNLDLIPTKIQQKVKKLWKTE